MAKWKGIPPFTGTENLVCIYKMYGRYYIRKPSSLTAERVKTDPRFSKTMQQAGLLAKASGIASKVYAAVNTSNKVHALFRRITSEARYWLTCQWKQHDILEYLLRKYKAACARILLMLPKVKVQLFQQKASTYQQAPAQTWEPLTHRKSVRVFVDNMFKGINARKNRQYDQFLASINVSP